MIVLDCNVAIAIVLNTEEGRGLRSLMVEDEIVIAPTLLYSETTSALSRYVQSGMLSVQDAINRGRLALDLVDRFYDESELWEETLCEASRLKHSPYAMMYFILARRKAATLFTLDKALQKLALAHGVSTLALMPFEK